MDGSKITFLEQLDLPGGSLDGIVRHNAGYVSRGGREMGHHFEVLWSLFSSLPSTEDPSVSVLDHFFYTNYDDPNYKAIAGLQRTKENVMITANSTLVKNSQKNLPSL
ncbi:oleate hydratase [Erysipelothrix sp. D19-032]